MAENNRGFGSMDEEKQREIARKGGKAAHESGNAHEFNSKEAAEAGRKGGEARAKEAGKESGKESGKEGRSSGQRGGSSEQHSKAGQQSHKNS